MSDRKDSFRHLIDAIKREPIKSQAYVNDYCEHENVDCIIFTQKNGTFSLLWKHTRAEENLKKKIATVLNNVQYIVVADDNDLRAIGAAKITLDAYNKENPSNVIAPCPDNCDGCNDDCNDEDDDVDDDFDEDDDDCVAKAESAPAMMFAVPTSALDPVESISRKEYYEIAKAVLKLTKKLKKLNRKVNEM